MDEREVLTISKWSQTFETADSKKHKTLSWISLPIDRQSSGYQSMIDRFPEDAPAIYGAWCALVSIAAACPERGKLANSRGEPMTIQRIARLAYMPEEIFSRLIEWATDPAVGWITKSSAKPDLTTPRSQAIDSQLVDDRLPIDCQSMADRSSIELPNTTQPHPTKHHKQDKTVTSNDVDTIDSDLAKFCDWWNTLHGKGLVLSKVETNPPCLTLRKKWKSLKRNPTVRAAVARQNDIEAKLRASSFARKANWLSAAKLLGGVNRDGEVIVTKLLDDGYADSTTAKSRTANVGAGVNYTPGGDSNAKF